MNGLSESVTNDVLPCFLTAPSCHIDFDPVIATFIKRASWPAVCITWNFNVILSYFPSQGKRGYVMNKSEFSGFDEPVSNGTGARQRP
jgi:hypothetical protein